MAKIGKPRCPRLTPVYGVLNTFHLLQFDNRASKAVLNSGHVRADIDSASPSDKSTKRKKLIRVELTRQLRSGSDEEEAWI